MDLLHDPRPVKKIRGDPRPVRIRVVVEGIVKFSPRALVVFLLFIGVFGLASDPRFGIIAVVAWLAVEALLWSGVAGFGRHDKTGRA